MCFLSGWVCRIFLCIFLALWPLIILAVRPVKNTHKSVRFLLSSAGENIDRNTKYQYLPSTQNVLWCFWHYQGAPGHLEASLSEGLNLGQMSPFWNPNGCQKGSKVVKYSVCWCILPLWNVEGSFLASQCINWDIKHVHPVEPSVLANMRWQLWISVVANIWVCPALPPP